MKQEQKQNPFFMAEGMSPGDFAKLSDFIEREYGIKMPIEKKTMLEARLRKRLRALDMQSFHEYCEYVLSLVGTDDEIVYMMDLVTTNKTDFFREPAHFDFLFRNVLPEMIAKEGAGVTRPLTVWSAGCSSGEEPYTLAMVLSEFAQYYPGFKFSFMILATDLSTRVLDVARRGIYHEEKAQPIPVELKKKYLLRSRDKDRQLVRVIPELRELVKFRRLNLMDDDFGFREPMDIIFCRNVIIYFDRRTQQKLVNHFYRYLAPEGYIFMGHSETLNGLNVPLRQIAPTIYRKLP